MTIFPRLATVVVILLCFSNSLHGDVLFSGTPMGVPFSSDDTTSGVGISYGFDVNGGDITVTDLGLWDELQDGFGSDYLVGLFTPNGTLIASVSIQPGTGSELFGEFRYEPIEPVVLENGNAYVLVAFYAEFTTDIYLRDSVENVTASGNLADGITLTGGAVMALQTTLNFVSPDGDDIRLGPNLRCPFTSILGDVNCDGTVDLLDVSPFVNVIISGDFEPKADINQDGTVDLLDVDPFIDLLSDG